MRTTLPGQLWEAQYALDGSCRRRKRRTDEGCGTVCFERNRGEVVTEHVMAESRANGPLYVMHRGSPKSRNISMQQNRCVPIIRKEFKLQSLSRPANFTERVQSSTRKDSYRNQVPYTESQFSDMINGNNEMEYL
eukprot:6177082-Pleurochrysis_carterae.AAC.3